MALTPGTRLGPYQVLSMLGAGGMGEVYRARDTRLDRIVAIKVLAASLASDQQFRERLDREARTISQLDHPHICTLFDVGEQDGTSFLVMQYLEGETLAQRLKQGALPLDQAVQYAIHIAEALDKAHRAGIVHRDLKPGNIMLTKDGAKLLDFGLAKTTRSSSSIAGSESTTIAPVTAHGTIVGTFQYMAPEVLSGANADARTDIWAFGVILYEMTTGDRPFKGENGFQLSAAILEHAFIPLPKRFGKPFRSLVHRCLEKSPDERAQTAREVKEALEAIRSGSRSMSFRRVGAASGAIAATILIVVFGVRQWTTTTRSARITTGRSAPVNNETRPRRSIAVVGFRNVSGREEATWLGIALSEMLTTELGAGDRLRTIPGETVAHMTAELRLASSGTLARETLSRIRTYASADLVAFGWYVIVGDRLTGKLRVDLLLQDAVTGESVSSIAETGTVTDLFDLVSRLGRRLRQNLAIPEPPASDAFAPLRASLPSSPEAARLYVEGLAKLRLFDALGARELLRKAIAIEPDHALAHSALAAALAYISDDANASQEAKKAFDLASKLSREDRLSIEGEYRSATRQWTRAAEIYEQLFRIYPDSQEHGLKLANALISGGRPKDALKTIEALRRLPVPASDDSRIDLAEAHAAESLSDFTREQASAETAVDKGIRSGASLIVASARIAQAWAFKNLGQPERAIAANEEAKRLYATAGDTRGVSRALAQLGATFRAEGRGVEAAQALTEALQLARSLGSERTIALALNNLANVYFDQGRFAEARTLYQESLTLQRQIGNKIAAAQALDNLASVLYEEGDVAASARLDAEALEVRREIGEKRGIAVSLVNMAEVSADRGELTLAKKMYQESLTLCREIGSKALEAHALSGVGGVLLAQGNVLDARKAYEQALAIRTELADRTVVAESWLSLGGSALESDDPNAAYRLATDAFAEFEKQKRSDLMARALVLIARAQVPMRNLVAATEAVDSALKVIQRSESRPTRLFVEIAAARVLSTATPEKISAGSIEDLVSRAKKYGFVLLEFEARLAKNGWQLRQGNAARARADLKELEHAANLRGFGLLAKKAHALAAGQR